MAIFLEQGLLESTACWNLIEQTDDTSCISLPLGVKNGAVLAEEMEEGLA